MDTPSIDREPKSPAARNAFQRLGGIVGSAILAIGAAALIGWGLVELYVKVVTLD
ncbi:hypothetical protein [Variovorax sp. MHTC-1]|uniref:hypothetical protein n=1 Tax=Variovorax sp. MHTC-1 TaxID=2495593 RepID=UPI00163CB779|nr:hypothetical protein [Variovorax sp. MHTC-1]